MSKEEDKLHTAFKKACELRYTEFEDFKSGWDATVASRAQGEPVAWMHENGHVVSAAQMSASPREGGIVYSSAAYTIPLYAGLAPIQQASEALAAPVAPDRARLAEEAKRLVDAFAAQVAQDMRRICQGGSADDMATATKRTAAYVALDALAAAPAAAPAGAGVGAGEPIEVHIYDRTGREIEGRQSASIDAKGAHHITLAVPSAAPEAAEAPNPIQALRAAMTDAGVPPELRGPLVGFFCNRWSALATQAPKPTSPALDFLVDEVRKTLDPRYLGKHRLGEALRAYDAAQAPKKEGDL